jgi:tight adherence protein B
VTASFAGVLAATCAAVSVLFALPAVRLSRPVARSSATVPRRIPGAAQLLSVAGALAVVLLTHPVQGALLACIAAGAVVGGARLAASARATRQADANRVVVVDYCEALLGELHAGQPVHRALQRCVAVWPRSEAVAVAASMGADVPTAMRRLAGDVAGAEPLHRLAAAWVVCSGTGAGLAAAVERVLETARDQLALDRLVQAELASARATARLVALLPVVVLVGAQGIGARPWQFLFSTAAGTVCLAVGLALAFAGLTWIDRIAAAARRG